MSFASLLSRLDDLDKRQKDIESYYAPGKHSSKRKKHRFAEFLEPDDKVQSIQRDLHNGDDNGKRRPASAPVILSGNNNNNNNGLNHRASTATGMSSNNNNNRKHGFGGGEYVKVPVLKTGFERISESVQGIGNQAWQEVEDEFQKRLTELNNRHRRLRKTDAEETAAVINTNNNNNSNNNQRPSSSHAWSRNAAPQYDRRPNTSASMNVPAMMKSGSVNNIRPQSVALDSSFFDALNNKGNNNNNNGSKNSVTGSPDGMLTPVASSQMGEYPSETVNTINESAYSYGVSGMTDSEDPQVHERVLISREARRRAREFDKRVEERLARQFESNRLPRSPDSLITASTTTRDVCSKKFYEVKVKVECTEKIMFGWLYDIFVADVTTTARRSKAFKGLSLNSEGNLEFKKSDGSTKRDFLSPAEDLPWVSTPQDLFGHVLHIEVFRSRAMKKKPIRVAQHTIKFGASGMMGVYSDDEDGDSVGNGKYFGAIDEEGHRGRSETDDNDQAVAEVMKKGGMLSSSDDEGSTVSSSSPATQHRQRKGLPLRRKYFGKQAADSATTATTATTATSGSSISPAAADEKHCQSLLARGLAPANELLIETDSSHWISSEMDLHHPKSPERKMRSPGARMSPQQYSHRDKMVLAQMKALGSAGSPHVSIQTMNASTMGFATPNRNGDNAGDDSGNDRSPSPVANRDLQQSLAQLRKNIRGALKQTQQTLQASLASRDYR